MGGLGAAPRPSPESTVADVPVQKAEANSIPCSQRLAVLGEVLQKGEQKPSLLLQRPACVTTSLSPPPVQPEEDGMGTVLM